MSNISIHNLSPWATSLAAAQMVSLPFSSPCGEKHAATASRSATGLSSFATEKQSGVGTVVASRYEVQDNGVMRLHLRPDASYSPDRSKQAQHSSHHDALTGVQTDAPLVGGSSFKAARTASIAAGENGFTRLFPDLPPFAENQVKVRHNLIKLGELGGLMDPHDPPGGKPPAPGTPDTNPDNILNKEMPAGFTYWGQFLDHDLTFDLTSQLGKSANPAVTPNSRTPRFDLDSMYGQGPRVSSYLYDRNSGYTKFLIDSAAPRDLPRNSQGVALIADPRNDENVIVAGLDLAFMKFHNAVVDSLKAQGAPKSELFDQARKTVLWSYQYLLVHQYLPATIGAGRVESILKHGDRFFDWKHNPAIPVEFSGAAFRFGHSQVRPGYLVNHGRPKEGIRPFAGASFDASIPFTTPDPNDLRGGSRAPRRFVDFDLLFDFGNGQVRPNKQIDTLLSTALFTLPIGPGLPSEPDTVRSLAQRNLLRQLTFGLPSGQAVAKAMGVKPLSAEDLSDLKPYGFAKSTPLWFYILREAQVREQGAKLGAVGGKIVAEVMIGLLKADRTSYLNKNPKWTPPFPGGRDFKMTDLLRFAGLAPEQVN